VWRVLEQHRDDIAAERIDAMFAANPGRGAAFTFPCAGLAVDFSKQHVNEATLDRLVALARERDISGAIERLFAGERVNVT
jgi:glucose-6-phosphate isomerase